MNVDHYSQPPCLLTAVKVCFSSLPSSPPASSTILMQNFITLLTSPAALQLFMTDTSNLQLVKG